MNKRCQENPDGGYYNYESNYGTLNCANSFSDVGATSLK